MMMYLCKMMPLPDSYWLSKQSLHVQNASTSFVCFFFFFSKAVYGTYPSENLLSC